MTDYKAVMKLLIQQCSYHEIENQLGCSHRAVSRANTVLRSHGFTTVEQVEGLTIDELDVMFVDGRNKVTLQMLWGHYTATTSGAGQRYYIYERFRQLVAQHVDTAGPDNRRGEPAE